MRRRNKSGRRQPAVGVREAHLQEHFRKVAGDCRRCAHERRCSRSSEPRGAYAPPALVSGCECLPAKNDFCDARTHIHKSGGREPAVGVSNAVAVADAFVQRPALARCWSETTVATVFVQRPPTGRPCATIAVLPLQARFGNHGWLTPAAPGCTHAGRCRKAVAIYNTGPSSSNNSHRRRISSQICGCDLQRRFVSHGGLTPPALVAERTFAGEKTIFAMHERTFTRAAGVSPPWV
jgi:hypothetical protein